MRKPKKTYLDKLSDAKTVVDVLNIPMPDYSNDLVLDYIDAANADIINYERDDEIYEDLIQSINLNLTNEEQDIFYRTYEQNQSLRVIATDLKMSHEKVRIILNKAMIKLREDSKVKNVWTKKKLKN